MSNENGIQLSIEEARSLYFDEDALRLPPTRLYRADGSGMRSYYTVEVDPETGDPDVKIYAGVTSLIHATTPTSPGLIQWKINMAVEGKDPDAYTQERADYGTIMHILFERIMKLYLQKQVFDLDYVEERVDQYCEEKEIDVNKAQFVRELKQDCLGFIKFLLDYKFKPIAIEMPLKCDRLKVAGTMDLFGIITVQELGDFGEVYKTSNSAKGYKKGDARQTKGDVEYYCIVDFKSSRKGVHTEHQIQLRMYEEAFKENFPEYKDVPLKLYNLRPKNWRTDPDYTLTDQTGKQSGRKLELLSELFYEDNDPGGKKKTLINGAIDFAAPDISSNYFRTTLKEIITNRHKESK